VGGETPYFKQLLLSSLNDVTKISKAARKEHANARMITIGCGVIERENDELKEYGRKMPLKRLVTFD
jgi:hypothetical protein